MDYSTPTDAAAVPQSMATTTTTTTDEQKRANEEQMAAEAMCTVHATAPLNHNQKRQDYISWDEYFMGVAYLSAMRSKDPRMQVGACIVSSANKILSMGYNGLPLGCPDEDFPWGKENFKEDPFNAKFYYVVHSELNAILNYRGGTLEGSKLYVTLFPCNECAKAIIQSGIRTVVYALDKHADTPAVLASKRMFTAAGVELVAYQHSHKQIVIDI